MLSNYYTYNLLTQSYVLLLTQSGRGSPICVSKLTIFGPDSGLSPGRHQTISWPNAGILLIWTSETNFREILSKIILFQYKKIHFKMPSAKWRQYGLGFRVLA